MTEKESESLEIRGADVKQLFGDYLAVHKLRRTSERFTILDAVYEMEGHFTLEALQQYLADEKRFMVSRATVYNTMNLLVEARLVIRHRLKGGAEYEKCTMEESHFHLVCTECGKVTEFHDRKLERDLSTLRTKRFTMSGYALYVYGLCTRCNTTLKRRQKRLQEKNNNKKK